MRDISSPLDGFSSPFGPQRNRTLQSLLFGQTEPGFTFEPWDITTLYQDRAGTTPVTAAGQSVGLRLDKSQGLRIGPELVTNGDFSDGTTGWSLAAGWTVTGGGLSINQVGSAIGASQAFSVVAGRTYLFEFDVTAYTSGTLAFGTQTGVSVEFGSVSSARHVRVFGIGGASNSGLRFYSTGAGFVGTIDNVSFKELAGNHQVAISDAKRGVYGWMPKTGRRNLLTYTEQFDNAAWTAAFGTPTRSLITGPLGETGAWLLTTNVVDGGLYQSAGYGGGNIGTCRVIAKAGTSSILRIQDTVSGNGAYVDFDLSAGTAGSAVSVGTGGVIVSNIYIQPVSGGWYSIGYSALRGGIGSNFILVVVGASGSTISVFKPQCERGSTATAYQRVNSQYDVTEAGVPTCYYVQADGVDDAYVTPTITPNTDKAQVFAGVRKLSDAATGIFIEHGTNSLDPGTLYVTAPELTGASGDFRFKSRGSVNLTPVASGTMLAPTNKIITGLGDISGDTMTLRVNGTQVAQSTADQGTGNFLAYPAYIYGRAGTSLPFNGLDFGHAVRFGPNLDAATIARVESLIARNTPEVTL